MEDLFGLQAAIVDQRARRGFSPDPVRSVVLLTEEIGENLNSCAGPRADRLPVRPHPPGPDEERP
jgi:hypothetical protein